jgi:3-methyladenine DNA glycosylase AlkD
MKLSEIRKILQKNSDERVKLNYLKFIHSCGKFYGVKIPLLEKIAKEIKEPNFNLVESLWRGKFFEEKMLAVKILARISKKDPERTLKLVKKFSKDISDWAICDTLGTQGIRKVAKEKAQEIFNFSKNLVYSKNFWQRRFGIVLLLELYRQGFDKKKIENLLKTVEGDKEKYVQKVVLWLKNEIKK